MDEVFMKRALELAKKTRGNTSPNPCVGAVIVKGGKIIGSGHHKKAGGDHAEIIAIKDALAKKNSLKGSVLYSTLEPCCHFGKTGPCVEAIVRFGIKKVVIGHKDPSKKVNGKGVNFLKKNGVEVLVGVLENETRMLNQPFLKTSKENLPFVTLKTGMSLDGKIATKKNVSKWITGKAAREDSHEMRGFYDAIVVGANTVIADNPTLKGGKRPLLRVIVDGSLRVGAGSKVFKDSNVLVACSGKADEKKIAKFREKGVRVEVFGKSRVSIKGLLKFMYKEYGVQSVFVEGGGEVNGSFVDEGLVDDVYFYVAPMLIGGKDAVNVVGGKGVSDLKKALKIKKVDVRMLKDDILIHGIVNKY